ncbi:MAG: type II toxin-antitoxin system RelE family toxin [Mycobacteriales bacterium]
MAEIAFLDAAIDDLRRLGPDVALKVLRKLLMLAADPLSGRPLGGELTGFRKLVVGRTWRVVYRVVAGAVVVCEVWAVGRRADNEVYAEAAARAGAAAGTRPSLASFAEVVGRLGRLVARTAPPLAAREPVPGWLAERLVGKAGFRPEQVAAMDAQQATDAWTEHLLGGAARRHEP